MGKRYEIQVYVRRQFYWHAHVCFMCCLWLLLRWENAPGIVVRISGLLREIATTPALISWLVWPRRPHQQSNSLESQNL